MIATLTRDQAGRLRDWFLDFHAEADSCLFAILDAARDPRIPTTLARMKPEFVSLYSGEPEETLAHVAPYLVKVGRDTSMLDWLLTGWGQSWGVFLNSAAHIDEVRRHLRRFLLVQDPAGKELYFRFYDPRVLRVFLPTCTAPEIQRFLGPIVAYAMESEDGEAVLEFSNGPSQTFPIRFHGSRGPAVGVL